MIADSVLFGFKEQEIKQFVDAKYPHLTKQLGDYSVLVIKNNPDNLIPDPHYMLLWTSTGYGTPGDYHTFTVKNGMAVVTKETDSLKIKAFSDVKKLSRDYPK